MKGSRHLLLPLVFAAGSNALQGANISKANNVLDLGLASSWIGAPAAAPGASDIAVWDFYFTSTGVPAISTDLAWAGIKLDGFASKPCQISAPNAVITELALGANGIESAKTTAANNSIGLSTDLRCTANQSWKSVAGKGGSIVINGAPRYDEVARLIPNYIDLGGFTVTVENTAVRLSGNNPSDMSISNGSFVLNNSTLSISPGTRWLGTDPHDPVMTVPSSLAIQIGAGSVVIPYNSSRSEQNLRWEAAVTLGGGTLHASGWGIQTIGASGTADSNTSTLGGSIAVTAASTLLLSSEIGTPNGPAGAPVETLHRITAPITGSSNLAIKNEASAASLNYIVLAGDNSGFTGAMGIVGDLGSRTVRLASDTAGSASATWSIGGSNTLQIENSDVNLGSVTGTGTVQAMGGGESTLRVGGGSFTGAITQADGTLLHFHKVGAAQHTYRGATAWNGETFVDEGTLTLTKASLDAATTVRIAAGANLKLSHTKVNAVQALVIDGAAKPPGIWGAEGSGAEHTSAAITGTGFLLVTGSDPYLNWIGQFADLSGPADYATGANPDHGALDNLGEFAFAGDPGDPSNEGGPFATPVDETFRYILPVRSGAVFSQIGNEMVSAPVDGIVYRIQASTGLSDFDVTVTETSGFEPAPDAAPLPEGWEYRSFETALPVAGAPRQFMRAVAEAAP
ncbi:hypothetical protein [Luteolibacter marinus]|uniref:hypothetical protein n=1 Tax=Luteolibacter marinus TaxID=2776705 RepID=UPI001868B165|nr:hypothetical protein [Luteolibacter marinus]